MAIEAFIPPSESKITIEKEVKQKPSIEELTTIEKPGRPVPADTLESPIKKKRTRTKKETSDEIKITAPKKEYTLIITEKPQAAQKIAQAIGKTRKLSEDSVNYYEVESGNQKVVVASAVGHLFNLKYKEGQKGWPILYFRLNKCPTAEATTT